MLSTEAVNRSQAVRQTAVGRENSLPEFGGGEAI